MPEGEAGKEYDYIDFARYASSVNAAQQTIGLNRDSSVFGYMPNVVIRRVKGVYKGARTYYTMDGSTSQGMPIFTAEGLPVGLVLVRTLKGEEEGTFQPSGVLGVLSAGTIQAIATTVRENL